MGAPASTSEFTLSGKRAAIIADNPAALTKSDKIYAAAEIVDRNNDLGEVVVDLQILHILGGRLPVGQCHMADAVGQQSLTRLWPS